jgi:hypothetical protein
MKFGSWTSHGDQIDLGLYHNMTKTENLNFYTDNKVKQLTFYNSSHPTPRIKLYTGVLNSLQNLWKILFKIIVQY